MDNRVWSAQQQAIFDNFKRGRGHLVVRARAGTGKTTTIIEAIKRTPTGRVLLCAFNKRIAEELQARCGPRTDARTLHSLGFEAVRKKFPGVQINADRGANIAYSVCESMAHVAAVCRVAARVKTLDYRPMLADVLDLIDDCNLLPDTEPEDYERVAEWAIEACDAARRVSSDRQIDFDDMVYVAVHRQCAQPKFDLVVIDECQDMSPVQIKLAQMLCKPTGRIVAVGDDRQAIYSFRGADSTSLDRLKRELRAEEMGLTVTYRCPRAVVAEAQRWVPDITAGADAPEGRVSTISELALSQEVQPGDFVLSRTNAPLVVHALACIRMGKPALVVGRDIGSSIANVIRKHGRGKKLGLWLQAQRAKAKRRLKGEKLEKKLTFLQDLADTIDAVCADCKSKSAILARCKKLFADVTPATAVVFSTVHKAKGLERNNVFVIFASISVADPDSANISYVAVTRAKEHLCWVV